MGHKKPRKKTAIFFSMLFSETNPVLQANGLPFITQDGTTKKSTPVVVCVPYPLLMEAWAYNRMLGRLLSDPSTSPNFRLVGTSAAM